MRKEQNPMYYRKPQYYDNFTCIADRCPATCCAGWQIVIDEKSLEKYNHVQGEFGIRLQKSIDWEEGVFHQYNRRCAFLNKENLCDLYRELGAEGLCDTCRLYPRHIEEFEEVREFSLSLSCPVAAEMILGQKEPVHFLEEADEALEEEDYEDFDSILYDWLEEAREVLFGILQNRKLSIATRMALILNTADLAQKALDHGTLLELDLEAEIQDFLGRSQTIKKKKTETEFLEIRKKMLKDLQKLEVLREEWPRILERLEQQLYAPDEGNYQQIRQEFCRQMQGTEEQKQQWEIYKEQLLLFFLYTYFCGSVYDDMIYTKAVLAVFSVLWIEELAMDRWLFQGRKLEFQDLVEVAYTYAREIEHSDENLNLLEEFFDTRSIYSPEKMMKILGE
ncbi:MAG: flagellin lysine-N-methylase [Blautia producta]